MIRSATLFTLATLLFSVRIASADFFNDCMQGCTSTRSQCTAAITVIDPIGLQEANDACANAYDECNKRCHVDDPTGPGDPDQGRKDMEEAEKKRQEQEQGTGTEGIKTYNFDK